jgi:hypothetical protein
MSQITDVGLKLIPMALVGKTDDRIKVFLPHQLPDPIPAASSLGVRKLAQSKPPFSTIDHRSSLAFY